MQQTEELVCLTCNVTFCIFISLSWHYNEENRYCMVSLLYLHIVKREHQVADCNSLEGHQCHWCQGFSANSTTFIFTNFLFRIVYIICSIGKIYEIVYNITYDMYNNINTLSMYAFCLLCPDTGLTNSTELLWLESMPCAHCLLYVYWTVSLVYVYKCSQNSILHNLSEMSLLIIDGHQTCWHHPKSLNLNRNFIRAQRCGTAQVNVLHSLCRWHYAKNKKTILSEIWLSSFGTFPGIFVLSVFKHVAWVKVLQLDFILKKLLR